jgi:hypothetical protein
MEKGNAKAMTDDTRDKRVLSGELLPASPRSVSLAPEVAHLPQGMLGIGLFARARYASEQKQFESYSRLVHAKNDLLRALNEQQALIVDYAIEGERARNLDDLRAIARQKIQNELAGIRGDAELNGLRFETEKERLLLERDRLRKARLDFNAPPVAPTKSPGKKSSLADDFNDVGREIEKVEAAYEELRAELIKRAGGGAEPDRGPAPPFEAVRTAARQAAQRGDGGALLKWPSPLGP